MDSLPGLVLTIAALLSPGDGSEPPQPLLGEPALQFELASLDHGEVRLSDYRGRPVVLHFATGW